MAADDEAFDDQGRRAAAQERLGLGHEHVLHLAEAATVDVEYRAVEEVTQAHGETPECGR